MREVGVGGRSGVAEGFAVEEAAGCGGAGEEFVEGGGGGDDESGVGAGGDAAVVGEAHGIGGGRRDKSGNVVDAGIQMADSDGVVEDLEGVVVAPSEEGVAHVVAGGGDGHAGADEFMHEGEAAPDGGGAHAARAVGG